MKQLASTRKHPAHLPGDREQHLPVPRTSSKGQEQEVASFEHLASHPHILHMWSALSNAPCGLFFARVCRHPRLSMMQGMAGVEEGSTSSSPSRNACSTSASTSANARKPIVATQSENTCKHTLELHSRRTMLSRDETMHLIQGSPLLAEEKSHRHRTLRRRACTWSTCNETTQCDHPMRPANVIFTNVSHRLCTRSNRATAE